MNKPAPSPGIPSASAPAAAAAHQEPAADRPATVQLDLHFFRVMKLRRVYPLEVKLHGAPAQLSAGQAALVVRPVIGGAVVTPSEQVLDLGLAGSNAVFSVMPLVKGGLVAARVEVSRRGRALKNISLQMKGKTQSLTCLLFLLTLIVPSVLLYYTSIAPLTGNVPKPSSRPRLPVMAAGGGDAPAPASRDDAPPSKTPEPRPGMPGEIVQYRISHLIHKNLPVPDVEGVERLSKENANYVVSDKPDDAVEWVAYGLGYAYQYLCNEAHDLYPAFFCAAILGALTLLSLVFHRTIRGRVRTPAIQMPADGAAS